MPEPLIISSLRGGLNDTDPPLSLPEDQVVLAENIDLDRSTCGARRFGHTAVTTSGLSGQIPFLYRHLPTADESAAQLWAVSTSGSTSVFAYKDTAWHVVTPTGADALDVTEGQYAIRAQTLHGKLFLAYPTVSGTDRLHVWDGTSIRRTGLAEPAAPSVTDSGSGTYAGLRYFRVRYTVQSGGATILRSEPSDATSLSPSGSGAGAQVTKPAAINEGETHWEVEESVDATNYYRIATVVVGTTTYVDTTAYADVATAGPLSADVGDYSLLWNPKFLLADEDRLVIAGSWEDASKKSRIGWTPVGTSPGVGNDERLEEDTDPYLDLDGYSGGELTDIAGLFGSIYAFKLTQIYKLVATRNRTQSYEAILITRSDGALPNSVVSGVDEMGRPCLYYVSPVTGPARIGADGIQSCAGDIQTLWSTVNLNAALVVRAVFYPVKQQVWWYLATDSDTTPTIKIVAHTRRFRPSAQGIRKGWTTHTGAYQAVLAACLFADNVEDNTARSLRLKPVVGTAIPGALIAMADTGSTDNGTDYRGYERTKPYELGGLMRKFGVMNGVVITPPASGTTLGVSAIRDFGREQVDRTVDLTPVAGEASASSLVRALDSLAISDLNVVQFEVGNPAAADEDWALEQLTLVTRAEESR